MKQLSRFTAVGWVLFSAMVFGCGGGDETGPGTDTSDYTDPVKLCGAIVKIECQKIYACAKDTPALITLANLPPTEADCNTQINAALNCAGATTDKVCTGDQAYPLSEGNKCLAQFEQAQQKPCSEIIAAGRNVTTYAPACGQCAPL